MFWKNSHTKKITLRPTIDLYEENKQLQQSVKWNQKMGWSILPVNISHLPYFFFRRKHCCSIPLARDGKKARKRYHCTTVNMPHEHKTTCCCWCNHIIWHWHFFRNTTFKTQARCSFFFCFLLLFNRILFIFLFLFSFHKTQHSKHVCCLFLRKEHVSFFLLFVWKLKRNYIKKNYENYFYVLLKNRAKLQLKLPLLWKKHFTCNARLAHTLKHTWYDSAHIWPPPIYEEKRRRRSLCGVVGSVWDRDTAERVRVQQVYRNGGKYK